MMTRHKYSMIQKTLMNQKHFQMEFRTLIHDLNVFGLSGALILNPMHISGDTDNTELCAHNHCLLSHFVDKRNNRNVYTNF